MHVVKNKGVMITKIHIENYVLIDYLDINFEAGLNIITGETGAGKSILLGAIGALLGTKVDANIIKDSGKNCVIEAHFTLEGYGLEGLFEELDIEYDNDTIIRRVVSPSGRSRSFINEMPVQLSVLKTLSTKIVDIHSQHQTLLLADDNFRMDVVDSVAGTDDIVLQYKNLLSDYRVVKSSLDKMTKEAEQALRDEEYLRAQHTQLSQAALKEGEKEDLEEQEKMLSHTTEIKEALFIANNILDEKDDNVLSQIKTVYSHLSKVGDMSTGISELSDRLESSIYELRDISSELSSMMEKVDDDPLLLEKTRGRLDTIYSIEQRYKTSDTKELIALCESYATQLSMLDDSQYIIEEKQKELYILKNKTTDIAGVLHSKREKSLSAISKYICLQLHELGMENADIDIKLTPSQEMLHNGMETVAFLFTANKGGRKEPIEKVASGGEMSRIMLSVKSLVARHKKMPTIIFDEIDTGVSGRVAHKMGEIMEQLSSNMQIINITHLPQVASKGDHHFFVYKNNDSDVTSAVMKKLSAEERIDHIATMLSGNNVTQSALDQAKELLNRQ